MSTPRILVNFLATLAVAVAPWSPAVAEENLRETVTVRVVRQTQDAVVNISSTRMVERRVGPRMPFADRFDFGDIVRVPANSLGSGFLIHADGYVVTNNHVIDKAIEVTVELSDGRKQPAKLVSADPQSDLALLRISADKPLPALALGDSADLLIGEPVIAVGNPLGYSHSISTGIVSAVNRDLKDEQGNLLLADLVQTDAAINPGNSGGPLLNAYGQVIGINTAIRGDAQNIGFAVPVSRLRDLIPELMNPAGVNRVEVGVKFREVRTMTPPATVSADVIGVESDGREWVVDELDGRKPASIVDVYARLLAMRENDELPVVRRDGDLRTAAVLKAAPAPLPDALVQARQRLGLTLDPINPQVAAQMRLSVDSGLLVTEVLRDSPAAEAGIRPGDVLVRLGRYPVPDVQSLGSVLNMLPQRVRVGVGVVRGNSIGNGILSL